MFRGVDSDVMLEPGEKTEFEVTADGSRWCGRGGLNAFGRAVSSPQWKSDMKMVERR